MVVVPIFPSMGCSELENPIGIETYNEGRPTAAGINGCSELENPIGIETTDMRGRTISFYVGCSELENPIGIETWLASHPS